MNKTPKRGIRIVESNLAKKIETEELLEQSNYPIKKNLEAPLNEPKMELLPVSKGLSSLEIKFGLLFTVVLFALLLLNVHSDLKLSTSSRQVQDLNNQIQTTEIEIENLEQHVQELSRYDRVHEIAEEYGLELHEKNIRNLSPVE